jgi:hypothetical protein
VAVVMQQHLKEHAMNVDGFMNKNKKEKKIKKIIIDFDLSDEILNHLEALGEWEKRSKRINSPLCGPIRSVNNDK